MISSLKKIVAMLTTFSVLWMYYLIVTNEKPEPAYKENIQYPHYSALENNTEYLSSSRFPSSPFTSVESPSLLKTIKSTIKSIITGTITGVLTPSKVPSTTPLRSTTERRTIIFLETSNKTYLDCRQACAVESAAKHNPNMNVTLFHVSEELNFTNSLIDILAEMPNVEFKHLPLDDYMDNSPLKYWYHAGKWKASQFKISHLSDALRFLTLWKFGGIYLDLDVVVIKSLEELKNCAGKESETNVAAGVMAFDRRHPFLSKCLDDFAANYKGHDWGFNGPQLITRILKKECGGIKNITKISREKCKGVTALPRSAFYAIPWPRWKDFFDSKNAKKIMSSWNESYLIHVWNKLSVKTHVVIGSGQPYELAAKKNCPLIYATNEKTGYF